MLWKVEEPFALNEISKETGKTTNINATFNKYSITENGNYLLASLYFAQSILEIYKKTDTDLTIYSCSATVDFHPLEDPILTEAKWTDVQKFSYESQITTTFATFDNTTYDDCTALFLDRFAQRQFVILKVANITGDIALNQVFVAGTQDNQSIIQES